METRTIIQGKIYGLFMNPISGRCEDLVCVAACSNYHQLVDWYYSQRCKTYKDGWMVKQFTKGSPLEYYNQLSTTELNSGDAWHHGIYSEWVRLDDYGDDRPPELRASVIWLG